jgi:hypothetical protein
MSLDLPYQVPSGHPLRAVTEDNHPLRREGDGAPSRAPWRRRSNALRARPDERTQDPHAMITGWWQAITRR